MKQFIYLDTTLMTSIMAQIDGGQRIKRMLNEAAATQERVDEPNESTSIEIGATLPIVKAKLNHSTPGIATSFMESKSGSEMYEFLVHDDLFNNMLDTLNDIEAIEEIPTRGKYINKSGIYTMVDLKWVYSFAVEFEKWSKSPMNREHRRAAAKDNAQEKNSGGHVRSNNMAPQQFIPEGTDKLISLMEKVLPSTCFIHDEEMIAFIKPNHLRDNNALALLKSAYNIHIVGFVYAEFPQDGKGIDLDFVSNPSSIPFYMISILENFNVAISPGIKIVEPIAVYIDESDY